MNPVDLDDLLSRVFLWDVAQTSGPFVSIIKMDQVKQAKRLLQEKGYYLTIGLHIYDMVHIKIERE